MRVAVVAVDTPHTVDTARTRRLDRIARRLAAREMDVTVCCNQWWDESASSVTEDGVTYRRVTEQRSTRRFAAQLPLVLRRLSPDVIHASYLPLGPAVSAATGRWLGSTPVVLDWYGDGAVDPDRRVTSAALRLPNTIVTPSRHVETTIRGFGAADHRTRVIPESVDLDLVRSQPPIDGPQIVSAGYLDDAANVDTKLLGLAELRDRNWSAMVIGDGPARTRYERKAAELRIDDRVIFPGELPLERRVGHYKAAHVFVQTAERCPFAIELLWALTCGCVGIVDYRENSAAHELIERHKRGFRTFSPEALSEAIVEAGDLEELTFNEEFTDYDHETVLDQHVAVYEELLA